LGIHPRIQLDGTFGWELKLKVSTFAAGLNLLCWVSATFGFGHSCGELPMNGWCVAMAEGFTEAETATAGSGSTLFFASKIVRDWDGTGRDSRAGVCGTDDAPRFCGIFVHDRNRQVSMATACAAALARSWHR
jgi:hypothetical protein